ncbi:hypothetical protein [Flavobacterium sp.]|uniref:hypothetical protein n=1 Tax=Flavobacterium sp. TaxID=239 RepID=UPI004033DEF4
MKKLIALVAITALMASCADDDTNNNGDEGFFALTEGNLWVYKLYSVSAEGIETSSGQIDSVRITGQQIVDGDTYFNFNHKIYTGSGFLTEERDELLRVNEQGHLITNHGIVIHPGMDTEYQYISEISHPVGGGSVIWQLEENINVTVEGNNYTVAPYTGYFTPVPIVNYPAGMACKTSYESGVGIVLEHRRLTNSMAYFEDRLIYYELN